MMRFGGKAVWNIDYEDYELSESHLAAAAKQWGFGAAGYYGVNP